MRVVPFPCLSQFREVHTFLPPPMKSHRILGLKENVNGTDEPVCKAEIETQM